MEKINRIDIKEFRELGFLQEVNRLFFHPLGLALEVIIEKDGSEHLGGVWDYRDDPEGILFDEGTISLEKAMTVANLLKEKSKKRIETLGFTIQPIRL